MVEVQPDDDLQPVHLDQPSGRAARDRIVEHHFLEEFNINKKKKKKKKKKDKANMDSMTFISCSLRKKKIRVIFCLQRDIVMQGQQ